MIKNILSYIFVLLVFIGLVWLLNFSSFRNTINDVVFSIFSVVASIVFVLVGISLLFYAFIIIKNWFTSDDIDSINPVEIFFAVVIGAIALYGLYYLINLYADEIQLVILYLVKIVIGTFVLGIPVVLGAYKVLQLLNVADRRHSYVGIIMFLASLGTIIYLEIAFGDEIIDWLKDYWGYFLGLFFLATIITIVITIKKDPTPK